MAYTNLNVQLEFHSEPDIYGDRTYTAPATIKARKQDSQELVKTGEGHEVLCKHTFYVDPLIEPKAMQIQELDKLDGEIVVASYVMRDLAGRPKMVRFYTK